MKPFSPGEAREIVESAQQPVVFLGMASDWPALQWSVEQLSQTLGERTVRFRIGKRQEEKTPVFETQCSYIEATLGEFLSWARCQSSSSIGPFFDYPLSEYWAYADYKYIAMLFEDKASMFEDVVWSDFGYPGRNGQQSTLWVGTAGANTPCHLDSYGCNLVLQVQGRKRWHLFPPEDTDCLYPTRIPYEESSVFSQVNVVQPDHTVFPAFSGARAHVVTLEPGQVLFVPRHWWHYVESLDPITVSINSWIEMEADDESRVGEALTRTVVCALKTTPSSDNADNWLNPTEDKVTSHDENLQYLNLAVQACVEKQRHVPCKPTEPCRTRLGKRDSKGKPKCGAGPTEDSQHPPRTIPLGPHLIPVLQDPGQPKQPSKPHPNACSSTHSACGPSPNCQQEGTDTPKRGVGAGEAERITSPRHGPISTNDLLECLVHPEVIALVTKLMMDRYGVHGST
ncbi:hypothetical protein MATL_G00181450 [Megalops atlanticus]|uniref:JmjC domain-containing protein n=1 Tax=Megalops atlanticus TaxID=7932 RepID=A0A9D3T794_MEGAT|nr:hypothetical protein MATL_G00181450 [Megalops atlanticus]